MGHWHCGAATGPNHIPLHMSTQPGADICPISTQPSSQRRATLHLASSFPSTTPFVNSFPGHILRNRARPSEPFQSSSFYPRPQVRRPHPVVSQRDSLQPSSVPAGSFEQGDGDQASISSLLHATAWCPIPLAFPSHRTHRQRTVGSILTRNHITEARVLFLW